MKSIINERDKDRVLSFNLLDVGEIFLANNKTLCIKTNEKSFVSLWTGGVVHPDEWSDDTFTKIDCEIHVKPFSGK